jgi:hypothetical protein
MVRSRVAAMISVVTLWTAIGCGSDAKEKDQPTPFGRACYEDVPCAEGLFCADVDGNSNSLCTSRCQGDSECRDRHGIAMCTDIEGYCAIDCRDVDCPGNLICISGEWCGKF